MGGESDDDDVPSLLPLLDDPILESLLLRLYGLRGRDFKRLESFGDANVFFHAAPASPPTNPHLKETEKNGYLLKIINSRDSARLDSEAHFGVQAKVLAHLDRCSSGGKSSCGGLNVPLPLPNVGGQLHSLEKLQCQHIKWGNDAPSETASFLLKVLTFVPGRTLYSLRPWSKELLRQSGGVVARLHNSFQTLPDEVANDPALIRDDIWSLEVGVPKILRKRLHEKVLEEGVDRQLLADVLEAFVERVLPERENLASGVIHGDVNDHNLIVSAGSGGDFSTIDGVIDFGDLERGRLAFDLAICIAYLLTQESAVPLKEVGGHVIAGYTSERPLSELDRRVIPICVAARYAQDLLLSADEERRNPDNEYLRVSAEGGWQRLRRLWEYGERGTKMLEVAREIENERAQEES